MRNAPPPHPNRPRTRSFSRLVQSLLQPPSSTCQSINGVVKFLLILISASSNALPSRRRESARRASTADPQWPGDSVGRHPPPTGTSEVSCTPSARVVERVRRERKHLGEVAEGNAVGESNRFPVFFGEDRTRAGERRRLSEGDGGGRRRRGEGGGGRGRGVEV
jgi:hypothetical protein